MGDALPDYVRSVVKADLEEKGDEDVFRKLHNDFAAAGVKVSDAELRAAMGELLAKAVADIEASASLSRLALEPGEEPAEAQDPVRPGPVTRLVGDVAACPTSTKFAPQARAKPAPAPASNRGRRPRRAAARETVTAATAPA